MCAPSRMLIVDGARSNGSPIVGTGVASRYGHAQPREEVGPPVRVTLQLGVGKVGVEQVDTGALPDRRQGELHRGCSRWKVGASRHAPGDEYTSGPIDAVSYTHLTLP